MWLPLFLWAAGPASAGLTLYSTIETGTDTAVASVRSVTRIQGPWLRRDIQGDGALAAYFGRSIRIVHWTSGLRTRLYPADATYVVDTLDLEGCSVADLVDLRPLGHVRGGRRAHLDLEGEPRMLLGCRTRPVTVNLESAYGVVTRLVLWICSDLRGLFGDSAAADLWCADADRAGGDRVLARRLARRLGIGKEEVGRAADRLEGLPLLIETRSTATGQPATVTRVVLDSVSTGPLPDTLFGPPPGYRPRPRAGDDR